MVILASSPGPSPVLRAARKRAFAIKTVASCHRKKCSTYQIASFVHVTKRHVDWFSFTWCTMDVYTYSRACDQAGDRRKDKRNTRGLFIFVDRSALLKDCQNKALWKFCTTRPDSQLPTQIAVDVCWKHYPQLSCCVRYHLIELNLHGDSAIDLLATAALTVSL